MNLSARIGVSAVFIKTGRVGGAEFMAYGLIEGLLACNRQVVVFHASDEPLDKSFRERIAPFILSGALLLRAIPVRLNRFVTEATEVREHAMKLGVSNVIFPNYFSPPVHPGLNTLGSILDLQYLHYPEFFSPLKRLWLRLAHANTLIRASAVSTISDFVRNDMIDRYGWRSASRVKTIPIGISWERLNAGEQTSDIGSGERPFILSVSSHYGHKNLSTLLRAFALVSETIPHDLVLVGQRRRNLVGVRAGGQIDIELLASELGIAERVKFTGHAPDSVLGLCYRKADLFVLPSLFEGFGMPAVEALGFGLPVITTRCGSLPEVTRGLARLVDRPTDPDELSATILDTLSSPTLHRPSADAVREIRSHYAPARIAQLHLDALEASA